MVVDTISDFVYKVQRVGDLTDIQVVHYSRMQFLTSDAVMAQDVQEWIKSASSSNMDTYEVDSIRDLQGDGGNAKVLVAWLGFPESEWTWEPIQQVYQDVPLLVKQFLHATQRRELLMQLEGNLLGV